MSPIGAVYFLVLIQIEVHSLLPLAKIVSLELKSRHTDGKPQDNLELRKTMLVKSTLLCNLAHFLHAIIISIPVLHADLEYTRNHHWFRCKLERLIAIKLNETLWPRGKTKGTMR